MVDAPLIPPTRRVLSVTPSVVFTARYVLLLKLSDLPNWRSVSACRPHAQQGVRVLRSLSCAEQRKWLAAVPGTAVKTAFASS
jgi:hypothetical protein